MDPKQFFNDSIRKRFARDSISDMSPQLAYVCHVMEKHIKTDDRKAGRYNLIHLIEKVTELNLRSVNLDELSSDTKE